jgi:D-lactate dehydrogenase (cytochrome)
MPSHVVRARPPRDAVAPPRLLQDPEALVPFLEDAAHYPGGSTSTVARPVTEGELAWLVRTYEALLPVGAQSSLTGGATPFDDVVVSTAGLSGIGAIGASTVRVQAGVPLSVLQDALAARGLCYPPVPTWTGAFVGGVIATNAAGAATVRYGTTRDWVRALTVVLASGDVLEIERGEVLASPDRHFEIRTSQGPLRVDVPHLTMPDVPKCSAGYFTAPGMDLVDLFVGAEGTLGVVCEATLAVVPAPGARWLAWILAPHEGTVLELVQRLRWLMRHPAADPALGLSAVEHIDARSLALLRDDGTDVRLNVGDTREAAVAMLVEIEDPRALDQQTAWNELAQALDDEGTSTPVGQLCRVLRSFGLLDVTEIVPPGDARRRAQLLAFREAAPEAVNRRVGDAKRRVDPRIQKVAGDFIVPLSRFDEMMAAVRDACARRGLDLAVWGHLSDGNVHPNVLPRSFDDVVAGRSALLEAGEAVIELGGSPLAEHGVGRNVVKQRLLEMLYGRRGVDGMRRVKAALDPQWKLARGVIFTRERGSGTFPGPGRI